jgi:exonuclease SbcC
MLKHIKYEVTFPTTGKAFSGDHNFEAGLTTITGQNEAGKSLILEFIRFSLHGAKALRTVLSKYKGLKVELDFAVKGINYAVQRTTSNAKLFRGKDPIAVGTGPVNVKVAELFGYGLDVFDASHAVNQGQIEALGAMGAADRKKMVDSVIGLNVLDGLIKFAGDTALGFKRDVETLEQALTPPISPLMPQDYTQSAKLSITLGQLQGLVAERNQVLGQLKNEPAEPACPAGCDVEFTVAELELARDTRQALLVKKAQYDAMAAPRYHYKELTLFQMQDTAHKAWLAYKKVIDAMPPRPHLDPDDLEAERAYLAKYEAWEAAVAKWNRHKTECPKCEHTWVDKMEKPADEMEEPFFTKGDLDEEARCRKAWENAPTPVEEALAPPLTRNEIRAEQTALVHAEAREKLGLEIKALESLPDVAEALRVRRAHDSAMALYRQRLAAWEAFQDMKATALARLSEIGDVDQQVANLNDAYQAAILYEGMLNLYERTKATYDVLVEKIAVARVKADQYKRAKDALTTLKAMVKSHLVPSLSKCASVLLSQMTGGQRALIEVNEDFDVKVDGQDLDELSGSAKAVANLSIRIALGMVLTQRVFPVLMADEVDAAMDIDRAGFTAECLRGLLGKIAQVILVSHKRLEADHYVELGEAA